MRSKVSSEKGHILSSGYSISLSTEPGVLLTLKLEEINRLSGLLSSFYHVIMDPIYDHQVRRLGFPRMSTENDDTRLSRLPNLPTGTKEGSRKLSNFSYTRDFLFSLSELDICKKLPVGLDPSILSEFEDSLSSIAEGQRNVVGFTLQSSMRVDYVPTIRNSPPPSIPRTKRKLPTSFRPITSEENVIIPPPNNQIHLQPSICGLCGKSELKEVLSPCCCCGLFFAHIFCVPMKLDGDRIIPYLCEECTDAASVALDDF